MKWLLIIMLFGNGKAVETVEFIHGDECQNAVYAILDEAARLKQTKLVSAFCAERDLVTPPDENEGEN